MIQVFYHLCLHLVDVSLSSNGLLVLVSLLEVDGLDLVWCHEPQLNRGLTHACPCPSFIFSLGYHVSLHTEREGTIWAFFGMSWLGNFPTNEMKDVFFSPLDDPEMPSGRRGEKRMLWASKETKAHRY